jgi:pimeloyl-ACP methyl ester carboxylesterase
MNSSFLFVRQFSVRLLAFVSIVYLLICVGVFCIQKRLLYHPQKALREEQFSIATEYGAREFLDSSGEFAGWVLGPDHAEKTVVVFHGNTGLAVSRHYLSSPFQSHPLSQSWKILLFEYPGFGHREGIPDEKTIIEKALFTIDSIQGPLILVGESLGSGVAAHVAAARADRITGILLIVPFNNMSETAQVHYPYLPIPYILTERYESDELLQRYHGKVALMIAENDEVIPPRLAEKLFIGIQSPKRKWLIPGVGHEGIPHQPETLWWQEAIQFLALPS